MPALKSETGSPTQQRCFEVLVGKRKKQKKQLIVDKEQSTEKILGMWWCSDTDTFTYYMKFHNIAPEIIKGTRKPTKREVLKILMTIFDPLGLIAPFVIFGKILLQRIWRTAIGWDERINDDLFTKWIAWVNALPSIDNIRVPRCYLQHMSSSAYNSAELHIFVDASEDAYAAIAYIRLLERNVFLCSIVAAKSKVAPLKPLSIPRLELQAALLGSRLAKSIVENQSIHFKRTFMWTDSTTVLSWIRSDARKYRQFVAFRIGEILDHTRESDWRWVPTKENVADKATKWQKIPNFETSSRWLYGPEFLYNCESQWPIQPNHQTSAEEELRPLLVHRDNNEIHHIIEITRFSKFTKLIHTLAYCFRFITNLRLKVKAKKLIKGPPTSTEYLKA